MSQLPHCPNCISYAICNAIVHSKENVSVLRKKCKKMKWYIEWIKGARYPIDMYLAKINEARVMFNMRKLTKDDIGGKE